MPPLLSSDAGVAKRMCTCVWYVCLFSNVEDRVKINRPGKKENQKERRDSGMPSRKMKTKEWKAWKKAIEKRNRPAKVEVPEAAVRLDGVAAAVGKEAATSRRPDASLRSSQRGQAMTTYPQGITVLDAQGSRRGRMVCRQCWRSSRGELRCGF